MDLFEKAQSLLKDFKADKYLFGPGVLNKVGAIISRHGKKALLISDSFPGIDVFLDKIKASMSKNKIELTGQVEGASPNCPLEDLARITKAIVYEDPDVVISFGGGSTIDAVKAAVVLKTLGGNIDEYFGSGLVTKKLQETGKKLIPHIAIQTAASSAAHLTKYSNITNIQTGQKKLIVDEAIVPIFSVFDYETTYNAPADLTVDGGIDGIAHSLEVLYSAVGKDNYKEIENVTITGIEIIVSCLEKAVNDPGDKQARDELCLGTDIGGYAIMLGGTNGGHLTSFSLVDLLSHGRACGLMNPYYTVFFAPAIEQSLKVVGNIFKKAGYLEKDIDSLKGRDLGIAIAEAMIGFSKKIGLPTRLNDVKGFTDDYVSRALTAAKNPQLKMKLQNMPIPLTAEMIDEYMGPIFQAAKDGRLDLIKNV
ncbi:MAG: iron-containing alcohol dehydrogenase [Sedimentisphaerales bacterium]|nr:iron-containing alcohol dehydrogenase [Sedimentisphaerales bacterium]